VKKQAGQGRRTQEALRQSEERFRLLVAHALDAVITIDIQGRITSWNPQAERLFGWAQAEVLGRLLSETIIPPTYREAHERGLARFRATGEGPVLGRRIELTDRKSTRLNSSHSQISYAVFCLNKKKRYDQQHTAE